MLDYRKFERVRLADSLPVRGPLGIVSEADRTRWLTYEAYYGMDEKPFALASDPRFFYHSQQHASAHEDLLAGIRRRESLSLLTGEIGTGKTTLCRAVLQCLDRQTFSSFVWDPFASREDLLKIVLMDFGVISVNDLTSGRLKGATRTELNYLLYEFLSRLTPLQAFAVVVIDEAQNLSPPLLEEIRILADSDGRERQLQVILVGQPELQEKLRRSELRQVEQRISVRCTLQPLSREGTAGYVAHRLRTAAATPDRLRFAQEAIDVLHQASQGVPRLINRIGDRALHHGHAKRATTIDGAIVRDAMADIGLGSMPPIAVETLPEPERVAAPRSSSESVEAWLTEVSADSTPDQIAAPPVTARLTEVLIVPEDVDVAPTLPHRLWRKCLKRLKVVALGAIALTALCATVTNLAPAALQPAGQPIDPSPSPPVPTISILSPRELPQPPATANPAARSLGWVVRVALFSTSAQADHLVDTLVMEGYPAFRVPVNLSGSVQHQVLAGPYATSEQAEVLRSHLRESGHYEEAIVVPAAAGVEHTASLSVSGTH
jgi:general secretion pathway protein A